MKEFESKTRLFSVMTFKRTVSLLLLMIAVFQSCNGNKNQNNNSKPDSMIINWTNEDGYYYADVQKDSDKKEAIRQLIYKVLQLSSDKDDWNSLILDKWIFNLGRLIGHIQNQNEAVGYDRGYRVALKFVEYEEGLKSCEDNYEKYNAIIESYNSELEKLILEALNEDEFNEKIKPFYSNNPFVIEICRQGERQKKTIDILKN